MPDQLLGVTSDTILRPIQYHGLSAFCTGWAGDREGTVYASLIGRVTAVTGIWAAFQDNNPLKVTYNHYLSKRPKLEGAKYHTLRVRLPESDWLHLVLLHTQATMQNLPDQDCYLLSDTSGTPPLARFWTQWNNALPLPALQEWTSHLWRIGERKRLIIPCDGEGTYCWRVRASPADWAETLQEILDTT
jgi:hypothetical protein